eukprot:COSAG04_NODE_3194_length_3064_cov_2.095447_1_plen_259_part_00
MFRQLFSASALPLLWGQAWRLSLSLSLSLIRWSLARQLVLFSAGSGWLWHWHWPGWAVLTGLHGVPGLPRALRQRRVRQIHLHTHGNGHQRRKTAVCKNSLPGPKEKFSTQRHLWSRPRAAACVARRGDPARTPTTPVTEAPTACPDPFAGPEPSRTSVQKRRRVPGLAELFGSAEGCQAWLGCLEAQQGARPGPAVWVWRTSCVTRVRPLMRGGWPTVFWLCTSSMIAVEGRKITWPRRQEFGLTMGPGFSRIGQVA